MPLPARRIAHTSRITHGHSREHAPGKTPLHEPHNAPDGTTRRRLLAYRHDDEMTTHRPPQLCPPAYRHDDGTPNATANCYPPHNTTERDARRDEQIT